MNTSKPPSRQNHSALSLVGLCLIILSTLAMAATLYGQRGHLSQFIGHDSFSLLPKGHRNLSEADEALVQTALTRQAQSANRQVIFLISTDDEESTQKAKEAFMHSLNSLADGILSPSPLQISDPQALLDYYSAHTQHIASAQQLYRLQNGTEQDWIVEVQKNAARPFSLGPSVAQDPLGNLQNWLLNQADKTHIYQNNHGAWQVDYEQRKWLVLFYQTAQDAFSLNTDHSLSQILAQAKNETLRAYPQAQIHMAGIPLHAAVATEQANREITWFGSISTIAVILLLALAYHSGRAIFAVTFSLLYGMALAFFATRWVFGQVHVLTLVFGTSLIGVAEDYGFHFLAARQNNPDESMRRLKKHIAPGMFLAFITTVLAYVFLGLPPFPALRQLAVFSVTGLLGTLLVVWFAFPYVFQKMPPPTPLNQLFAAWWRRFVMQTIPLPSHLKTLISVGLIIVVALGWTQVQFKDDLRQMQNSPTWLMNEQRMIGQALNEANSQFFLVSGASEQDVLHNEEKLRGALDQYLHTHPDAQWRYRAISEWLPSIAQQQAVEHASAQWLPALQSNLGLTLQTPLGAGYIEPNDWLKQPFTGFLQRQWLGQQADGRWATVLNLTGTIRSEDLSDLAQLAQPLPHTLWVDNVSHYGQLLAKYRNVILMILAASYIATLLVLWPRYRRNALWLLLPPLAGSLLTVSILGWLGIHVQLFSVLPLLLILGMGIDYGIFLIEHLHEQERMWMVTCMSTISTILSLGMLGFSSTPALHILGLTLGLGIFLTWLSSAWVGKWLSRHLRAPADASSAQK